MCTRFALISLLALAVSACSTTTFQTQWRNPNARPIKLAGQKVVGVFMSGNPTLRRSAEDAMVRELNARGAQGVPAYTVLSDSEILDRDSAKQKLESMGFAGAVVMRVVGSQNEYRYEPGSYWTIPRYRRFWGGYWSYGWTTVYQPGYLSVDRVVSVETLVYSFAQDELVWAGVSRTVDPKGVEAFIAELASAVAGEMTKAGLLARAKPEDDWGQNMGMAIGLDR
jgi:hypothetical protein